MNTLVRLSLAWLLVAGAAQAQLPSADELAMAVRATAAQARQAGLALQEGALWRIALHHRTPLVAAHVQGTCHLGYSAYTPGRDYRWLFPTLAPVLRARWMAGVVHHELAHCAEQAEATAGAEKPAGSVGLQGHRQQEVLADLAFALHVDADQDADGAALVVQLAHLRAAHAAQDPGHDTAAALHCYLRQRGQFRPGGAWLAQLQAWRQRCGQFNETLDWAALLKPHRTNQLARCADPGTLLLCAGAKLSPGEGSTTREPATAGLDLAQQLVIDAAASFSHPSAF